jgi:hypothetical protein
MNKTEAVALTAGALVGLATGTLLVRHALRLEQELDIVKRDQVKLLSETIKIMMIMDNPQDIPKEILVDINFRHMSLMSQIEESEK